MRKLLPWPQPEFPVWMLHLPDNSKITTKELAAIFKRPARNFLASLNLRYSLKSEKKHICFLSDCSRKRANQFSMGDVRALVKYINSGKAEL